jgi:hypothetical protein
MYSGIGSFVKKYSNGGGLTVTDPRDGTAGNLGSYEEWKASLDPKVVESLSEDQLSSMYDAMINLGASGTSGLSGISGGNTSTGSTLPPYASVNDDGRIVIPPSTTNYEFIQLLNTLGYFADADPYDYQWLLKHFAPGGDGGGDDTWLAEKYNTADSDLDVSSIAGMNFTDQNKDVFTRLFELVNTNSRIGGFTFGSGAGSVGQPYTTDGTTEGTSTYTPRPLTLGPRPTGGVEGAPYYSLSDILVSSSEQPNLYDRFDPYPEGGFQVTDPYSGTVTQSSPYPAAPPLPGITPVTTPATSVEGTVGGATTTTSTTPTAGTGAPPADSDTTTTDTTTTDTTTTDTTTTDTGTTTTGATNVRGLPSYSDIEKAIMNVEGLVPGPRKYGSGSISGIERSYQKKRARQHVSDIFRQYLGRGAESSAIDYYAPMVLQAASLGGNRGRQAYFNIIDEIKNSEEGQLFAQSGQDPLAPKMDYYATPEPWYTDQLAKVDFSQEYLSPADYAGVNDYIFGKRGILGGQRVKQDSLRNLSTQEFMDLLATQSGTGAYGGDLIYDPNQGIIYSGISDRMDEARRQNFMDTLAWRRDRNNAMASSIDPSLLTETEKVRARHLYGGYGTTSTRIGDTQYFVNDDGTISALDVQDIDYDYTPKFIGFAEGGIVDVYSGDMANLQTTGEGIESFLNPERSKATLRRNLAKLAPRPTVPVMQQGIMPMAR